MSNDIGSAIAAFGMGYLGAKKEKKEREREEKKWQAQLAVSVGHLKLAQEQEQRMLKQMQEAAAQRKAEIASKRQQDASDFYIKQLENGHDSGAAWDIAQRTYGFAPSMSKEEGAALQSNMLQKKVTERQALANIETASARAAAAAQGAAMRTASMQGAMMPALMGLVEKGLIPLEQIPALSEAAARGSLPDNISSMLSESFSATTQGKDFDAKPLQQLTEDGKISPAQSAALIAAYKSGTVDADTDAKVQKLIAEHRASTLDRDAADKLINEYDVPADIRAKIAADTTGFQARAFLEHAAEYGLKPKTDQSAVTNAVTLREMGVDPTIATQGPAAVVGAIGTAPAPVDTGLAEKVFTLGGTPEQIKGAATGGGAFLDSLSQLTKQRDQEAESDARQREISNTARIANILNWSPQTAAQAFASPDARAQAMGATAAGFTSPGGKNENPLRAAASDIRSLEATRDALLTPINVQYEDSMGLFGKKPAPVIDANGNYVWKNQEAKRAFDAISLQIGSTVSGVSNGK